ncbi:MAG: M48 family metalloprotease [Lysobacterales bacterium]
MRTRLAAGALIAFATMLSGCRSAPVADARPGAAYAVDSDEAGLRLAMDEAEQRLRNSPLRISDPQLQAYVEELTCRLAGEFCPEVRVYLIDLPYANASMAPNGVLQVWAGLLLRARDEAELAYVIGHELGHYRHRHVIQQWRSAQRTQALLGALQVLTAGAGAGLVGSALGLGGAAALNQFSRDHERAADRFGFATLASQGYDVSASYGLYEQLAAEEAALPPRWRSVVFASHPPTAERLKDMRASAGKSVGGERFRERYWHAVAASQGQWLRADLSRRQLGPSRVLLDSLLSRAHPDERGTLAYFRGEVARLENDAHSSTEAERWYRQAIASAQAPVDAHRELGLLLRAGGKRQEAAVELDRYLELAPDAEDRVLIAHYLTELRS